MSESMSTQRRERELASEKKQRSAAIFLSLFLHGTVGVGLALEQMKREVEAHIKAEKTVDMVKDIQLASEQGKKISAPEQFLQSADALKNNFFQDMVNESNRHIQLEVNTARQMVESGKTEQQVADYLLSRRGEYKGEQNSVVQMMSRSPEKRAGNCEARFLRLASEFPQIYPEKYEDGLFAAQLFQGADTDGDGNIDTEAHIRFVVDLQNGTHLIVEGQNSQVEKDLDPTQRPTTVELSQLLTTSFLVDQRLYTHPQGVDTRSKYSGVQFKSFLQYPGSHVSYGPNPNPDAYSEPVPSTGWTRDSEAFAVTLLDAELASAAEAGSNLPTIGSVEEARKFSKDGIIEVDTITSPEAARELVKGFKGELIIQSIPSPEVAKELVQSDAYDISIYRIDSPQVAEALLSGATWPPIIEVRILDSVEVAQILAHDSRAVVSYEVITPQVAEVLSRAETPVLQVKKLTPEIAQKLASGTLKNLDTELIDTPELARALKSGSITSISIGIGDTYGSSLAVLGAPDWDPELAQALVGGSVKLFLNRYETTPNPQAVKILTDNGIQLSIK